MDSLVLRGRHTHIARNVTLLVLPQKLTAPLMISQECSQLALQCYPVFGD